MIDRILGGYRLEEKLGSGAFGTVYRARHVDTDWVMAVKVAKEHRFAELIRDEGKLLAKLVHPNVVRLQHMESGGDTPFVVVEYVDGENLAQTLRNGPMEPKRVLGMARQLLAGLGAAHELGILHLDIKPSNVLIAHDGTAKLADFGLGRLVEQRMLAQSMSGGSLTASMMGSQVSQKDASGGWETVGTIAYMAPEQMRGDEVDCRADLYSLGVVLYEALTCELPVGRFELPGESVEGIPESMDRLLEVLLATRQMKRPGSAAEASALLESATASPAGILTPPPPDPALIIAPPPPPAARIARAQPITVVPLPLAGRPRQGPGSKVAEEIAGPDGGPMVWVPPGEFMMGSNDALCEHEQPVHKVRLTQGFWLGEHTVTNAQYRDFCAATNRVFPTGSQQADDHPVVYVSWDDAMAYCQHHGLSLPTEAEWEYAARGTEGRKYPWGDEWDPSRCCCFQNKGPRGATCPAKAFALSASWCGAVNLAGNVWEWCREWYGASYYRHSPVTDPRGPDHGDFRVSRGGAWSAGITGCRASYRYSLSPSVTTDNRGFRCLLRPTET